METISEINLVPKVSVVIPTIGRPSLRDCIQSVLNQSLDSDEYEVIVCDDGSNSDYCWLPSGVTLIRGAARLGSAVARNNGIERARADVVAFTDDDCIVPYDWLQRILEAFRSHPEVSAVGGYLRPVDDALATSPIARAEFIRARRNRNFRDERTDRSDESPAWGTNNVAWLKDALEELGGLNGRMKVAHDSDLARRAGDLGMSTRFISVPVLHNRAYTWRSHWQQHFDRGRRKSQSDGSRSAVRAFVRLPYSTAKGALRIRSLDPSVIATVFVREIAFSMGRLAVPTQELRSESEAQESSMLLEEKSQ